MDESAWGVLGVSVPGSKHRRENMPCQDAHCWQISSAGDLIAAVGDGAGSSSLGQVGSEIATRSAVAAIAGRLHAELDAMETTWQETLRQAFAAASLAVREEAVRREQPLQELATTLAVVVARPGIVAAGQIGDGAIIARLRDGEYLSLTRPQTGEFVNETIFLTTPGAEEEVQLVFRSEGVSALCLLTDGLQQLALRMPQADPHPPFFAPFLRLVEEAEDVQEPTERITRFLQSPRVTERTDDDLTLIVASLRGSAPPQ
jgi:serine/threonine protein phosphatase PrpC